MLTILPEKDPDFITPILQNSHDDGTDAAVLVAKNSQEILGYIAVDVIPYTLRILKLSLTGCLQYDNLNADELQLADALLKAALSYGINRNAFRLESEITEEAPLLRRFGFQQFHDKMVTDASKLVGRCNNC